MMNTTDAFVAITVIMVTLLVTSQEISLLHVIKRVSMCRVAHILDSHGSLFLH